MEIRYKRGCIKTFRTMVQATVEGGRGFLEDINVIYFESHLMKVLFIRHKH